MRHGWFRIAGVQEGDRDPAEQLVGCEVALAEARGAVVLDLGCAEGCIAAEFARAGAVVTAVDVVKDHVTLGKRLWAGLAVDFVHCDIAIFATMLDGTLVNGERQRFDIVIALGSPHKLADPGIAIRFAARAARRLVLLRTKPGDPPYELRAKHPPHKSCQVDEIMAEHGFRHVDTQPPAGNKYGEAVQYWRKA